MFPAFASQACFPTKFAFQAVVQILCPKRASRLCIPNLGPKLASQVCQNIISKLSNCPTILFPNLFSITNMFAPSFCKLCFQICCPMLLPLSIWHLPRYARNMCLPNLCFESDVQSCFPNCPYRTFLICFPTCFPHLLSIFFDLLSYVLAPNLLSQVAILPCTC
jgi:hypothetical protein